MIVAIFSNSQALSADEWPYEENEKKPEDIISLEPGSNNIHIRSLYTVHLANSFRAIIFKFGCFENHLKKHECLNQRQYR